MSEKVLVPDIGDAEGVEVIEISVSVGDTIETEQTIIVLESDKATIEVPAPSNGVVKDISVKVGDTVSEGDLILVMEGAAETKQESAPTVSASEKSPEPKPEPVKKEEGKEVAPSGGVRNEKLTVPDLGGDSDVEVIEVSIQAGDQVEKEQTIIVLESDKASMEIPSSCSGKVLKVFAKVGDKLSEGDEIAVVETAALSSSTSSEPSAAPAQETKTEAKPAQSAANKVSTQVAKTQSSNVVANNVSSKVHAGPAVRRLANELGADLMNVKGSGPKGRILKEDVHAYVKQQLSKPAQAASTGSGLPDLPDVDFSKFGEIEKVELSKIQKVSANNLHRSWLHIPHVTQFDEADITDLEAFRKQESPAYKEQGVKLTPLAFMVKACAYTLKQFPKFNCSLDKGGEHLIMKHFINIGIAVDTPNGLVVPVIKNADKKSIVEIAQDLQTLSEKARNKKLSPADMQGGTFSISSLGGIGGTAFTPIVNWPEVCILGVSRSAMKPVYVNGEFQPRLMLPLSLSYDHRVIDGADAARFTTYLSKVLGDIRRVLL